MIDSVLEVGPLEVAVLQADKASAPMKLVTKQSDSLLFFIFKSPFLKYIASIFYSHKSMRAINNFTLFNVYRCV